jgi:hypothetical protein
MSEQYRIVLDGPESHEALENAQRHGCQLQLCSAGHEERWQDFPNDIQNDLRAFPSTRYRAVVPALGHAEGEAVATIRDEASPVDRLSAEDLRRICALPVGTKLSTRPAPEVAVPEEWKLVPKRATKEMAEVAAERRGCAVSANLYATINAAIAAAPTAPAGERDDSQ